MTIATKPTLLQVVPALETGGAERTALDISAAVIARGWRSIIASGGGRMVPELEAQGATHITLPLEAKNPLTLWTNARALARIVREEKVRILHARSRGPAWSCLWAKKMTGVPFVTTYHGAYSQSNPLKAFYNSGIARADVVIANSEWTADLVRSRNPFALQRVVTVHRGTDFARFAPETVSSEERATMRRSWDISDDCIAVLHLARLTGWKGQQVVIDCAAKLKDAHPNLRWVLAGDHQGRQDYLDGLKASIVRQGLEGRVVLPGHCDAPAIAMAASDAVVVASTDAEAFGRAAVEASAFEKPLVVTDIGAVVETVLTPPAVTEEERTGWKVPPGDADAMAQAFDALFSMDETARARIGKNARAHATANFSLQQMCDKTIAIYEKLLETR